MVTRKGGIKRNNPERRGGIEISGSDKGE